MQILHDGELDIAVAGSRDAMHWKNTKILWSGLVDKISRTHLTHETHGEYMAMLKSRQDEIKDVGGFVGGYLTGGRRKKGAVAWRQIVTLDIDSGNGSEWDAFCMYYGASAALYSTHKHSPAHPRLRILIPLDRPVMADEYEAIARRIAGNIDIESFKDITTFRPTQLMYWPSTSRDGVYSFEYQDGPWLSADEILKSYHNWQDASEYPRSTGESETVERLVKKQEDPTVKKGIVGAFCRTYNIHEVIEKFLADEYEPCDIENRYTYKHGSTSKGLVIYDDLFAYSHHGSDPTSNKTCNAFDLVRLHKYGDLDQKAMPGTPSTRLPSFVAMQDFARSQSEVVQTIAREKLPEALKDFEGVTVNTDWLKDLQVDRMSRYLSNVSNMLLILRNDPRLCGCFAYNDFEKREMTLRKLPWRAVDYHSRYLQDFDDVALRVFFETEYGITGITKISDCLLMVCHENTFHPVKDYLDSLHWDGTPRVDQFMIDYQGCEDSGYTRAVTRKVFLAAVARIMQPGITFEYEAVLVGKEGTGKSTVWRKLGQSWFSDSFNFHMIGNKQAEEQLQGAWIMETAEMTGMKKAEHEAAKAFIGRDIDRYRVSYGKRLSYFPRQGIFVGSTNEDDFLKGITGNRRFWPLRNYVTAPRLSIWDITQDEINQLFAEAVAIYESDEILHLDKDVETTARAVQKEFTSVDDRQGTIIAYLEIPVPFEWESMRPEARSMYLQLGEYTGQTYRRNKISAPEIWVECLGKRQADMTTQNTKFIHDILKGLNWVKKSLIRTPYGPQSVYVKQELQAEILNLEFTPDDDDL